MVHLGMSCPLRTHTCFWRVSSTNESGDLVASRSSTTRKFPINRLGCYNVSFSDPVGRWYSTLFHDAGQRPCPIGEQTSTESGAVARCHQSLFWEVLFTLASCPKFRSTDTVRFIFLPPVSVRAVTQFNSSRQKNSALGAPAGPAPGWKTKTHRRYISKDRELLKQLEHACSSKSNDKTRKFSRLSFEYSFPN